MIREYPKSETQSKILKLLLQNLIALFHQEQKYLKVFSMSSQVEM